MLKTIVVCLVLAATAVAAEPWTGLCVAVADGDTIRVLDADNREVRIRIYGIDAPERGQPFGTASRDHLATLAHRREVTIRPVDIDRYGRVVGLVEADGVDVNRAMIEAGLAWVYTAYCRLEACGEWRRLEAVARDGRLGLWGGSEPPVPPWQWRRERRGR
jgi:endonuclease YncB( thermonuclease family)